MYSTSWSVFKASIGFDIATNFLVVSKKSRPISGLIGMVFKEFISALHSSFSTHCTQFALNQLAPMYLCRITPRAHWVEKCSDFGFVGIWGLDFVEIPRDSNLEYRSM